MNTEKQIERYFRDDQASLPSNFDWQVMQQVYALKVAQARRRAIWESGLVTIAAMVSGLLLFFGYAAYSGTTGWQLPSGIMHALPAILILGLFVMLDAGLAILKR